MELRENEGRGIGAETIGGGMAERIEPAIAHHQVEAHGEKPEDQRLDQDGQRILRQHERQQHADEASHRETDFPAHLILLAQQAAGPDDQNDQHQEVHEREREVLEVVGTKHLHEADQNAADEGAEERAHATDDDDDEGVDDHGRSHTEKRRNERGGEHATQGGHGAAEAEHAGAHQIDIGAERVDHFRILRHRADQQTGAGAIEELPQRDRGGEPERDQEQPVERKRLVQDTVVVLVTMLLLTVFLFVVDAIWYTVLSWRYVGVIHVPPAGVSTAEVDSSIEQLENELSSQQDTQKQTEIRQRIAQLKKERERMRQEKPEDRLDW